MNTPTGGQIATRSLYVIFLLHALTNMAVSVSFEGAYNIYYPVILQGGNPAFAGAQQGEALVGFGLSAFLTGVVMSLDNIIGVVLGPIFGAMGDKSLRRKEYTVAFGYLSAAAFALLPVVAATVPPQLSGQTALLLLPLSTIIGLAVTMAAASKIAGAYRLGYIYGQVPSSSMGRLQSFTVISGGLGFILTMSLSSMLYKLDRAYPFYVGAAVVFGATLLFHLWAPPETEKNARLRAASANQSAGFVNPFATIRALFRLLPAQAKLSMLMILLVQNLGKFGITALQTYSSSWMVNKLGLGPDKAGLAAVVFFCAYLATSVPMGFFVDRYNKTGLYLIAIALTAAGAFGVILFGRDFATICAFSAVFGVALSIFDTLTIPYAMSFVPEQADASGTVISMILVILSAFSVVIVPLCGFLIDVSGDYNALYYAMGVAALLALIPLRVLHKLKAAAAAPAAVHAGSLPLKT